jgi:hypothetical protein
MCSWGEVCGLWPVAFISVKRAGLWTHLIQKPLVIPVILRLRLLVDCDC